MKFSKDVLTLDCATEVEKIIDQIKLILSSKLHRRGLIVGVSGGIDSSVTLALAVKAIGAEKVLALQMPEVQSASETERLSSLLIDTFNVNKEYEDITGILQSVKFYEKYIKAVKLVVPEYSDGWKSKIVISDTTKKKLVSLYSIVAQSPSGEMFKKRLTLNAYLNIVAVTNFKQRIRKMLEYYHADRLHYATTGTPNRLEYDQGFFVKLGDGAADIKPIAHLYKTQVYNLAKYLGVSDEICKRPPTTDTYSLEQGQDEFFFSLPYGKMDLCLYGKNNKVNPKDVSEVIGIDEEHVKNIYADINRKRLTTKYLHLQPQLVSCVPEIKEG